MFIPLDSVLHCDKVAFLILLATLLGKLIAPILQRNRASEDLGHLPVVK